ncbi:MAG: TrmB family transcriptional regulator [Thermoplasmatota archaeon]
MDPKPQELANFGLTDTQIAVYRYLLLRDCATAPEVASGAQLPRNRSYEILDSLAALGLVQCLVGNKRQFRALPIGPFIEKTIQDREKELSFLRERAPQLERELKPQSESIGYLGEASMWRGRAHVTSATHRVLREAHESLLLQAPPSMIHRWLTPIFGDVLEARHREGLEVRLLATQVMAPGFDALLDIPVRTVSIGGPVARIVADRQVLLRRTTNGGAEDIAYEVRNEALAEEALALFEHLWACEAQIPAGPAVSIQGN